MFDDDQLYLSSHPALRVLGPYSTLAHWRSEGRGPGLVFCPPIKRREVIAGLVISFSMWQCVGHGEAVGPGFVD